MTTLRVRPVGQELLEAVAQLEAMVSVTPWSLELFRDEWRLGSWMRAVLDAHGQLAGYVVARRQFDEWHLLKLGVAPAFRRQGLGRRLVAGVLRKARRERALCVLLEVRASNHIARMLYEAMGFEILSVRRAYYRGRQGLEDALVMTCRLAESLHLDKPGELREAVRLR
ncbi:MAG: ribosomal protein S18-alanine N-acetyltransferase [Magnetococcales bacterium]|nr:ribosomal protein S18-alanine N-acetyltransferase [Magnetococcales bacterium]